MKIARSRTIAFILIFSCIVFFSPNLFAEQINGKGNLIGKVYSKDGTTVIEGAIVNIRNVATDTIYKSSKTDMLGTFKIEEIEKGLYSVGIVTKEGNFNLENLVGIKANKTAIVTFALKQKAEVRGKVLENPKTTSKIAKFFSSPIGIAIIIVSSVAIIYGVVTLTGEEEEVSPFKN